MDITCVNPVFMRDSFKTVILVAKERLPTLMEGRIKENGHRGF